MDDFILILMRKEISRFYDKFYIGNVECMKNMHLTLLEEHYDSKRFDNLSRTELRNQKIEFLTELQDAVNKILYCI